MSIRKTLSSAIVASLAFAGAAHAFPDGPIDFVIPYGPGGGNDTMVRMIAPAMERALPEGSTVVPQNVQGAGGQRGATTVYRAEPDGHTIGLFAMPGLALPELTGTSVEYNLREMTWLGRIESADYVLLVQAESDIHSLDDLVNQDQVTFLATGFGSTGLAAAQLIASATGMEADFVTGYPSSTEALVGLIRGDGDASVGVISPSASYVESGDLRAIALTGASDIMPDVPTLADLGHPELSVLSLDRWVGGPPDLDPEVREILEDAILAATQDPEFMAQAQEAGLNIAYLSGEEVTQRVADSFEFYERYKDALGNPAE